MSAGALVLLTAFVAPITTATPADSTPEGGAAAAEWTAAADAPPQYPNVVIEWDVPITMSDGTVLKGNVYRPADASGHAIDTPTPTVLNLTPYTKLGSTLASTALDIPVLSDAVLRIAGQLDLSGTPLSGVTDSTRALANGWARNFAADHKLIRSGYTQVVVDVRGTGFSQGVWDVFRDREQQDTVEVIDWVSHQPWSTGEVGMNGMSYSGINQLQAAAKQPPALKAIFPMVPSEDPFRDLVAPGGALGVTFMPAWLGAVNGAKLLPDLTALTRGDFDLQWLFDRVQNPMVFLDVLLNAVFSPRVEDLSPQVQQVLDDQSVMRRSWSGHPERIQVPTFIVGGWHDVFVDSQVHAYNEIPLPPGRKQLLMSSTYHLNPGANAGSPGSPPRIDVLQRAWFDKWLKGIDNGIDSYGPINVQQQGGGWLTTPSMPQPGVEYRRMYLSAAPSGTTATSVHDGSLLPDPSPGEDRLTVAPGVLSICSRDSAQETAGALSLIDMCAKDSRIQEANGLTFTSAAVAEPTTVSGPITVHLETVHDATDGFWTTTVNDVAPDGQSRVLASGQLVASLRAIDESRSARDDKGDYTRAVPFLSLAQRQVLVPGARTGLDISINATDAVLQPGHRLRVDVYASNLLKALPVGPMLVDSGLSPQHVQLRPDAPSFVNLPLLGRSGW
ncbi:CocE/NonD family hydrolase [Nocardia jejuensis]|uniref:CocE/NonD family hydrolase n=1 Tax=Nocardia jejuensis TaxID=328049 RepID=UPI000830521E|nr:CocE/NonD family hydrolase [Nocardia jejuensis]